MASDAQEHTDQAYAEAAMQINAAELEARKAQEEAEEAKGQEAQLDDRPMIVHWLVWEALPQ